MSATRAIVTAALGVAIVAICVLLLTGGSSYTLHLRFLNAGRVVQGGEVQIAGVKVGSITGIGLTPDGLADITIKIDNGSDTPLHRGTRAAIRELGAATIANNFIDLRPGPPTEPALPDGATLPPSQTLGIVDLDAILDSLTPPVRASLQHLFGNSAQVFAGSGSRYFNRMLLELDPALSQLDAFTGQLASDQASIRSLISSATATARAVASRSPDLRAAVDNVARALGAVATVQQPLADALTRAPAVLGQGRRTLADLTGTLSAVRPTLRAVPGAAPSVGEFLSLLTPTVRHATPVVHALRSEMPGLRSSLTGFPVLEPLAVSGLGATSTALAASNHILRGFRLYGPDFILGILNGLLGIISGNYNKAGHYGHIEFTQSPLLLPGGELGAALPGLTGLSKLSPALFNILTHQVSRCPGSASPPAPDGSSPWIPDPSLCNPAENVPMSVDQP